MVFPWRATSFEFLHLNLQICRIFGFCKFNSFEYIQYFIAYPQLQGADFCVFFFLVQRTVKMDFNCRGGNVAILDANLEPSTISLRICISPLWMFVTINGNSALYISGLTLSLIACFRAKRILFLITCCKKRSKMTENSKCVLSNVTYINDQLGERE